MTAHTTEAFFWEWEDDIPTCTSATMTNNGGYPTMSNYPDPVTPAPPPIVGSGSGDTYGLNHSRRLGIAEANLVMIQIIAETAVTDTLNDHDVAIRTIRDIADLARKTLVKTGHIKD